MSQESIAGPIGIFDSGIGGLTVFREVLKELPEYDYIYLGDNARSPYGIRSLPTVYEFTLESISFLFNKGCNLIILACNTASANALRSIQQNDLPKKWPGKRVLGVIRPTTERMNELSATKHMGIFATEATVRSGSYLIEAKQFAPELQIHQQACPLWVPMIENDELDTKALDDVTRRYVDALLGKSPQIDSVLLACTHYPLIHQSIRKHLPDHIRIVSQGELVALALRDWLNRNEWMDSICTKNSTMEFYTTDDTERFNEKASLFFGEPVASQHCEIGHQS